MLMQPTYSKLIVKVAHTQHINPKAFVGAEWVYSDLLAHFEELVSENWITGDFLLVLDGKSLQTRLELSQLRSHSFELISFDLSA